VLSPPAAPASWVARGVVGGPCASGELCAAAPAPFRTIRHFLNPSNGWLALRVRLFVCLLGGARTKAKEEGRRRKEGEGTNKRRNGQAKERRNEVRKGTKKARKKEAEQTNKQINKSTNHPWNRPGRTVWFVGKEGRKAIGHFSE